MANTEVLAKQLAKKLQDQHPTNFAFRFKDMPFKFNGHDHAGRRLSIFEKRFGGDLLAQVYLGEKTAEKIIALTIVKVNLPYMVRSLKSMLRENGIESKMDIRARAK